MHLSLQPLLLLLEPVALAADLLQPPPAGGDTGVLGGKGSGDKQ
ncbi:MAG TPA: hypothetical protein VFJ81_15985 [Gemmatimonadales bacterium]|nr:hypothetical protein [Gemmatimonadales bacterium]